MDPRRAPERIGPADLADQGSMSADKFPMFFDVDGTLVKIDKEGDEVFARTSSGLEYPPFKAYFEGEELTADEFNRRRVAAAASEESLSVCAAAVSHSLPLRLT